MSNILVYGSLRRHSSKGYNCDRCGPQHHIRTLTLPGFSLHSLGAYPAIAQTDDPADVLTCELHEVNAQTAARIDGMEVGAGYTPKTIDLPEGPATIYVFPTHRLARAPKIKSGDWV